LFDINDLLPGGVGHFPSVAFLRRPVLHIVLVEREGLRTRAAEVLNEEIGVAVRRRAVALQFLDDSTPFLLGHLHPEIERTGATVRVQSLIHGKESPETIKFLYD